MIHVKGSVRNSLGILIASVLLGLTACAPPPLRAAVPAAPAMTKVRLPMGFIPNIQYAPYYIAVDKGYFAAEGIEMEFDYKFETDGVKLVGAGELPFAVVSGEQVILARSKQLPVLYVLQWFQKFPIAIVASGKANVNTAADLKGKTIGLPGLFGATYVGWRAFLNANGLSEADVQQEAIGFTQVAALSEGKKDVVVGYVSNEPIQLESKGIPIKVFRVSDQVNMVANGIMTSEKVAKENPELVRRFLRALLKGMADTMNNPDEAMKISTKFVETLKADDGVQRKVLDATIELMKGGSKPGASEAAAWENTQTVLLSMGQIKEKMDVNSFFSNAFLP